MPEVRGLRALAVATAAATYVLIVAGAIVRVTGSGLGCGDHWPLCNGYLIPIFDLPTLIEWSHRLAAALVAVLLAATTALALWKYRSAKTVTALLLAACGLLAAQIVLGAATVKMELSPAIVAAHLGVALAIFACVLAAAALAVRGNAAPSVSRDRLPAVLVTMSLSIYALIITGAFLAASGAKAACPDWPLCRGAILPVTAMESIHMLHRYTAAAVGALVLFAVVRVMVAPVEAALRWAAGTLLALFAAQVGVGALNVLLAFPAALNGLHIALASAVWGISVVLAVLVLQSRRRADSGEASVSSAEPLSRAEASGERLHAKRVGCVVRADRREG